MKFDAEALPGFAPSIRYAHDRSSLTVFPCTSSASLSSDASSQSDVSFQSDIFSQDSDSSSISSHSDSDTCDSFSLERPSSRFIFGATNPAQRVQRSQPEVAPELRQNPRRTAAGTHSKPRCPPTLVRQSDRKVNFVDSLVDSSTQIVEAIWPLSSVVCRSELGNKAVLPLRTFIQETLRRSRTSYSTLQVALYYLILIKPHVPKRDFTMEQTDDRHTDRALQCGRRMFLAALILASKYLQDRNYSARAWSKISGLNTQEINQNEIAFLLAVNWKLHITDAVFARWSDIVLKYTPPPSPPSPGGISPAVAQQTAHWRHIILGLNSELTNIDSLIIPNAQMNARFSDLSPSSPRSILNLDQDGSPRAMSTVDVVPPPRSCLTPMIMEPTPAANGSIRMAPSLGNLPTPRLTPQSSGFCTPAASAATHILGKSSSMGMAMSQANNACAAQYLDRVPMSMSSSPQGYCPLRRSSLATSVSTASSPESMVSDMSRTSRSSSISSASSLLSANANAITSVPPRFRASRLKAKPTLKLTVPSVPEDYDEYHFSSSPESYSGPDGRIGFEAAQAHRQRQLEDMVRDPASDAARALQDLHNQNPSLNASHLAKIGRKRSSEMMSMDGPLHDNVRNILNSGNTTWSDSLVSSRAMPLPSEMSFSARKRLCCASEAVSGCEAIGMSRPGMWHGILN